MIRNAWLSDCSARGAGVSARAPVSRASSRGGRGRAVVFRPVCRVSRVQSACRFGPACRFGRRVAFPPAASHGRAGVSRARSAAGNPQLLAGLHGGAAQGVEVDDLPDDHAGVVIGIRALGH
jgi:hypothetical protein